MNKLAIFHGYVSHNQMVIKANWSAAPMASQVVAITLFAICNAVKHIRSLDHNWWDRSVSKIGIETETPETLGILR